MQSFIRFLYLIFSLSFVLTGGNNLYAQQISENDQQLFETLSGSLELTELSDKERIEALFHIGLLYNKTGNTDSARFYLEKALQLPGGKNYQGGRIIVNIANAYVFDGKYSEALKHYLEALDIAENSKNKTEQSNIVRASANLGECYYNIGNYSQALYYAEKALIKHREMDFLPIAYILPQIYYIIGSVYLARGELESAEENMQSTFDIADSIYRRDKASGIVIYKSYGMEGLARVHLSRESYTKALESARKALVYAREDGNVSVVAKALAALSDIYFEQEQYENSRKYALEAIEINTSAIEQNPNIAFNIAVSEMFAGNTGQAYHYFQVHSNQIKLNTDRNFRETMASMEVQYKTEQQEMRIAVLEKDKKLYTGLGIAIITTLLSGLGFLYYSHRSKRKLAEQQIKQLEQEKELIATRSALEAEKTEREVIARDLHDGVGAMLSVVKNNMNIMKSYSITGDNEANYLNKALDGLDKSIAELRRVAHHIMPATLIDKGLVTALDDFCRSVREANFHFSDTSRRFDPEKELVIYRCAYELVNNALRHSGASSIDVHLNMDEQTVYLSVVDNGCGFDTETTAMGMGMNNMRTRLASFGGRMDIYSEPGKGTEISVEC